MIRFSIRRPVTIAMLYCVVAALGVFAWRNVPLELLPDVTQPRLSVSASWSGTSPEVVEAFLTSPLEAAIQQVEGVDSITSTSTEGSTRIGVGFALDTDMEFARLELSERLAAVESELPCMPGCRPSVEQYVPREFADQNRPLLYYRATGPYTLERLREYLVDELEPELVQVEGVGAVTIAGGRDKIIEVQLDETRIQALGLSPAVVNQAIANLEIIEQAGVVRTGDGGIRPLAVRERVDSLQDILDQPISVSSDQVIRVSDVARVFQSYEEPTGYERLNALPVIRISIGKAPRVNSIETAERVKAALAEMEPSFLPGMRLILDSDQSEDIKEQLTDLRTRAAVAAIVVLVVLLLFLRSIRAATIVFATIAFAIMITINLVYFGGLTLNVLTLMGLAMGFGLIVDNAIVVLENVYRLRRRGVSPYEAAERGAKEVVLPILAATGTTVIVLIPFVYLQGELRMYYVPLATVVGLSLIASLFVAFTFIPALAARLLAALKTGRSLDWKSEPLDQRDTSAANDERAAAVDPAHTGPAAAVDMATAGSEGTRSWARGWRRALSWLAIFGRSARGVAADASAASSGRGRIRRLVTWPVHLVRIGVPAIIGWVRGQSIPVPIPELAGQPWYTRLYANLISFAIRHAWVTVFIGAAALGGSWYLFDNYVTRNSLFNFGGTQRTYISITIRTQPGEGLDFADRLTRYFEDRLIRMPEISEFRSSVTGGAVTSGPRASITVEFPDELQYSPIPLAIEEELIQHSLTFGGTDIIVRGVGPAFAYGGSGASAPNYTIQILGYNYDRVRLIAEELARHFEQVTRVREIDTNSAGRFNANRQTEIILNINRERLASYGLSVRDVTSLVGSAVRTSGATGGRTLRVAGEDMQLSIKLEDYQVMDVQRLEQTLLPARSGQAIRLGDVVDIDERYTMSSITRANQQYNRFLAYEFRGPAKLGDFYRDSIIDLVQLPPGYTIVGSREYTFRTEDKEAIYRILGIGIILIFMITAALFESFKQPLCVLLTVPMALIGVFLIFFYMGASFTREAYIGVIMMSGIVVNNAILLVDHVNQLRWTHGQSMAHALMRGSIERVRPILMTSLTTICGLLPLVLFAENADSRIWNALAYTLIGGLASSTILVLTVTPALYMLFERKKERKRLAVSGAAPAVAPEPAPA